ncbi:MAG: D-glycero-beta-D-manno-heptose 1-phosphate adenylyltransferase [Rhodospirillales bacterium]|nr:D-glycero-beta-D-manno-heptose 1-phosphate adenylyltransferase [Rhodospirillales bacterium]
MLDRFVAGSIERISPEAPVPVLHIAHTTAMPGGAGNVARNVAALGGRVRLISVIGDDAAGAELSAALAADPNITAEPLIEAGRRTTVKTRFIAASQQVLRADEETTAPLSVAGRAEVEARAIAAIADSDAVLLSDYAKGVLGEGMAARLIAAARAAGRPVIVDPKGRDFRRYAGASVITPNRRELAEASGVIVATPEDAVAAARSLLAGAGIDAVVATLGGDGLVVVSDGGAAVRHLPAIAREVFDVTGAGDTVVAALALLIAAGTPLAEAAAIANVAAGIVVGKVGTAVATAAEIAAALRQRELAGADAKLCSRAGALEQVAAWRRQGLVVGFTNGCFDLIHPGHLSLLRQARAACDRLVVGLNSDASVRRLKGSGRPVQSEAARGLVLAALADVDLVVIFDEETPAALIEALRPGVLVKGADYRIDEVVGAAFVRSIGGRVLLARLEPGYSTSATLARLATGEGDGDGDQEASSASTRPAR